MSRYLNVFHSYSQGELGDIEREKVLENNVTRAFVITLHSSPAAGKWLLNKSLGTGTSGELTYQLQRGLDRFSKEPGLPKEWRRRFVLCIAPKQEQPRHCEIPTSVVDRVLKISEKPKKREGISQEQARRKFRLQRLLSERVKELDGESESQKLKDKHSAKSKELVELLGGAKEMEVVDNLNSSDLRYLYDLTRGSRPDATVTDTKNQTAVLIESKIHGSIVDAQIVRHIKDNFQGFLPKYYIYGKQELAVGKGEVPVCICTWRDIYSLFEKFRREQPECQGDPKLNFIVKQFLEYLEDNNMGELKFEQKDFLDWEDLEWGTEDAQQHAHNLLDRVKSLSETLAQHIGQHWVNPQNISRNYIGVNIVHNRYDRKDFGPVEVPHWSLAVQQHGAENRCLRLFIQCEGKKLTTLLLKNNGKLQSDITGALLEVAGHVGISLRVEEKLFIAPGGKREKENLYNQYFVFPLELCKTGDVGMMVSQALQAMEKLQDPERRKQIMSTISEIPSSRGKTIVGVLQLNYQINWLELKKLGVDIEHKLKSTTDLFKKYYDVLLERAGNAW
jgi:hypothetical protein